MYISKKWIQVTFVVLLVGILAIGMIGCSQTDSDGMEADDTEYEVLEETMPTPQPPVQIEMPDYELTYAGELKDSIIVNEVEGENSLEFKVKLSEREEHIFTLCYNSDEGELVTVMEDAKGNRIPVAFKMAEIPEDLTEEDRNAFYDAQDAVNEIVVSLVLK